MLKKKIILGGLILASLIVGITNAFIMPINEETTFGDGTIICDQNFNCITENANGDTFNGISPSFLTRRNWFVFFNSGLLSEVYGYNEAKNYYVQKRPIEICRTDYNSAINYTNTVSDYLSGCANNISTGNAIIWSEENLGGKITSYTINTLGSNAGHSALICANYNEDIKSACFNVRDNLGNNYDFGISDTIFNRNNFVGFGLAEASPRAGGGPDTEGGPIICKNINTMIKAYGNKYNTGMCYTPSIAFSGNQIVNVTSKSIFEIFTGFEQYQNLSTLYYNNCHAPYTAEHCTSTMSGYGEAVNFFNYIERANETESFQVTAPRLYQYCHLQLNFTDQEKETETTCTLSNEQLYATGITEETGTPGLIEMIHNMLEEDINVLTPTTGTVFDEFLEDGETRIDNIKINRVQTFREAYDKVMGLFKYRNTQTGIIPGYIVSLIMIILLLALFRK